MTKEEGYGYEWDALLIGGPADGCLDRVIEINGEEPPVILKRIVDGNEIARESLGEKLIEYLTSDQIDGNQRVAVYRLREVREDGDTCLYDYLETIKMHLFREKYQP
jgi:hypothetical protein